MTDRGVVGGPISEALEADLRTWVRRHGIVLWLDLDDHYSEFVERLARLREENGLPYDVHAYRGSHLDLMLELEASASSASKRPMVIHLPRFNEETVGKTPILELYEAGARYRKALPTLVEEAASGQVPPDEIALALDQPELTLEAADSWLEGLLAGGSSTLAARLRTMTMEVAFDELLGGGALANSSGRVEDREVLWSRLAAWTGASERWKAAVGTGREADPEDLAFAAAGWALAVEYASDLERSPVNPLLGGVSDLPGSLVEACRTLAAHLRSRHPKVYRRVADETEALLADEVEVAVAGDLGAIDTFRFEDQRLLKGSLDALSRMAWGDALAWASQRLEGEGGPASFWLRADPARQSAWQLIHAAARLGTALAEAGPWPEGLRSLDEGIERYAGKGADVDLAHRELEQRRTALLYPQVPEFDRLRGCLDAMRAHWREWADEWARGFNHLCQTHGFLSVPVLRQRALFDEEVQPAAKEAGTTALFMVDGLRYEMGKELYEQLKDTPAATIQLKPRLAELPTVTAIGMNVLAPVQQRDGRLKPVVTSGNPPTIKGFSTGEFQVTDPESRKRAMHERVGGGTCPLLALNEVVRRDAGSLRRSVAQAKLVIVHSREIDKYGEDGVGPAVFDLVMQRIRAAWRLLRDAGVRRFVITSDHGFLLLDENQPVVQSHGRRVDPDRRHVYSSVPADHRDEVRVALSDLGYDAAEGYLMFPESTALFDTGGKPKTFVHGGNSLQERVIPVLTVHHRAAAGGETASYGISSRVLEGVAGMHCLEVSIAVVGQGALDFGISRELEVAMRVPGYPDIEVELCQVRGAGEIQRGAVRAGVGESFEVFFRLLGSRDDRVPVELYHPSASAQVQPHSPDTRFALTAKGERRSETTEDRSGPEESEDAVWLEALPEGGPRRVFKHLAEHGTVTEPEAVNMLGSPRAFRRFTLSFEKLVKKAPFAVRIDTVGGVKRYVREGGEAR